MVVGGAAVAPEPAGATLGPIAGPGSAHTPCEIGQCIWPISRPYLFNALNNKWRRGARPSCISQFFTEQINRALATLLPTASLRETKRNLMVAAQNCAETAQSCKRLRSRFLWTLVPNFGPG